MEFASCLTAGALASELARTSYMHRVHVTGACKHTVVRFRDFQHFQTAMLVLVKCSASGSEETIP